MDITNFERRQQSRSQIIQAGETGERADISSFDEAIMSQLAFNGVKNNAYKSTAYSVLYIILRMVNIYKIIGVNVLSVYV